VESQEDIKSLTAEIKKFMLTISAITRNICYGNTLSC